MPARKATSDIPSPVADPFKPRELNEIFDLIADIATDLWKIQSHIELSVKKKNNQKTLDEKRAALGSE